MHRRDFSRAAVLSSAAAGLALPWVHTQALAQSPAPKEGEYIKLSRPAPVDAPANQVEVVEFFWYNCPHCYKFEPLFESWAKKAPAHIAVRRIPVAFRDDNVPQQRLYYVLEAMGKVDELHGKVFNAVHAEKQRLNTQEEITSWIVKQGVDKAKFTEFYSSFSVAGKARRATQLTEAYEVDGVPALGVAGKYFTSGPLAKSMERALQVVEQLAQSSRKA
jgi:protein dithiol oxidoreductase (disulfide-forming)